MDNFEPKKLLILRILEILTEYSDSNHKLRQVEIISLLKALYGIECERKAVARNIEFLQQAGYEIVTDKDGVYLAERRYEIGELRLLIDSVFCNMNVRGRSARGLIDKLSREGGKYFKSHTRHTLNLNDWQKEDRPDYFYNIELLCKAIEDGKQVEFYYNSYGVDKKLHHRSERKYVATPYQLFVKNNHYYVALNFNGHDNLAYCRVGKITELQVLEQDGKPISQVDGCACGINLGRLTTNPLPYLFEDEPRHIEFVTANGVSNMIDDVIDWFGKDVTITELPDGNYMFSLVASPWAMKYWLLQHGKYVKVLAPQSLVDSIKADIEAMQKLYD